MKIKNQKSNNLSDISLGIKFQVQSKQSQNLKFCIEFKINLKIFLEIFNKNVNFSTNITIRFVQKVN